MESEKFMTSLYKLLEGTYYMQNNGAGYTYANTNDCAILTLNYPALNAIYRRDALLRAIIEKPVKDAFSKIEKWQYNGRVFEATKDLHEKVNNVLRDNWNSIMSAIIFSRLHGGGALVLFRGNEFGAFSRYSILKCPTLNTNEDLYSFIVNQGFTDGVENIETIEVKNGKKTNETGSKNVNVIKIHKDYVTLFKGDNPIGASDNSLRFYGMSICENLLQKLDAYYAITEQNNHMISSNNLHFLAEKLPVENKIVEEIMGGSENNFHVTQLEIIKQQLANSQKLVEGKLLTNKSKINCVHLQSYGDISLLEAKQDKFFETFNTQYLQELRNDIATATEIPKSVLFESEARGFSNDDNAAFRSWCDTIERLRMKHYKSIIHVIKHIIKTILPIVTDEDLNDISIIFPSLTHEDTTLEDRKFFTDAVKIGTPKNALKDFLKRHPNVGIDPNYIEDDYETSGT